MSPGQEIKKITLQIGVVLDRLSLYSKHRSHEKTDHYRCPFQNIKLDKSSIQGRNWGNAVRFGQFQAKVHKRRLFHAKEHNSGSMASIYFLLTGKNVQHLWVTTWKKRTLYVIWLRCYSNSKSSKNIWNGPRITSGDLVFIPELSVFLPGPSVFLPEMSVFLPVL